MPTSNAFAALTLPELFTAATLLSDQAPPGLGQTAQDIVGECMERRNEIHPGYKAGPLMKTLSDAFEHTLQDMYYAETALLKALPTILAAVGNAPLKAALKHHLQQTKGQLQMLDQVFESIGKPPKGEKCDAIIGLIKECEGAIEASKGPVAKHAVIIGCCQAIEHYEIARYGTLREWAKELGQKTSHDLLSEILDQEKAANHTLTHIAVTGLNGEESAIAQARPKSASATS